MSNLFKRVLVGVVGIPLLIFLTYLGGYYFISLCVILQAICLYEFLKMFENKNINSLKIFTIVLSILLLICSLYKSEYFNLFVIGIPVVLITLEIFRKAKQNPLNPVVSIFSILYITVPFYLFILLDKNYMVIIFIFALIWACDTFAYFGGKYFGKHKLSEISPNKTIEGSVFGFIFTVLVSLCFYFLTKDFIILKDSIILGIIIGMFSQVGDNFESMLKRFNGVKDSSNIIPGHGGLLDRFDSLVFVIPFVYIYVVFFN